MGLLGNIFGIAENVILSPIVLVDDLLEGDFALNGTTKNIVDTVKKTVELPVNVINGDLD